MIEKKRQALTYKLSFETKKEASPKTAQSIYFSILRNSSREKPDCLMMEKKVPLRTGFFKGTMTRKHLFQGPDNLPGRDQGNFHTETSKGDVNFRSALRAGFRSPRMSSFPAFYKERRAASMSSCDSDLPFLHHHIFLPEERLPVQGGCSSA